MTEREQAEEFADAGGGMIALAFVANVLLAGVGVVEGKSFTAAFIEAGTIIWGFALTIVLAVVIWAITASTIEYLLLDFRYDLRRWMDR